ncbi:hypothetical protein ONZ51_g9264 [Trametes cubensis]|uniref:Uncharacterized protein n=1 Tax=Trametes cubensis TaxID=1111947 RepID=A0AAD7X8G5_9APHY|nr:hypothetical protein ONZ51_g9264 [Trametes cubensis]
MDILTTSSDTPRLPQEMIDHILAFIRPMCDDKASAAAALYRCALAGRELLYPARGLLYKEIDLTRIPSSSAGLLSRTLHADPELGKAIKTLHMNTDLLFKLSRLFGGSDYDLDIPAFPFHLMPELHTLMLCGGFWLIDLSSFAWNVISCFPKLEYLDCDRISFAWAKCATSPPSDIALPKLKTLCFRPADGEYPCPFAELLQKWLRPCIVNLHTLTVVWTVDILTWLLAVSAASANLRSLTVSTTDWVDRPAFEEALGSRANCHAYVFDIVAQCASLQFLCINFKHEPSDTYNDAPALLEALCDLLSRNHAPLPQLTHLELKLAARDYNGDPLRAMPFEPALRARFSECLLDRDSYPQFRSLAFCLWLEYWMDRNPWDRRWEFRFSDPATSSEKETLVKTWRTAFTAFDDAPRLLLDVHVL